MRVALLTLTRGRVSGGYRKYLDRLVPLLRAQSEVERLDVFVPPQMMQPDVLTWPGHDEIRGFPQLRSIVAGLRPDVVFIPSARLLRVGALPVVTMVRNMEPLEVPFGGNRLSEGVKNVVRATAARYASLRSDRVIAVSEHVRDFLVERWSIAEERVGVVYHGVDPAVPDDAEPPLWSSTVADQRFLFTAGSVRPARGLEDVVMALGNLPEDVRLVIAGGVDPGADHYHRALLRLAKDRGVESRIVWAGQLNRSTMLWCFRRAEYFVMTSRAEACPNVVLEAMAEGTASVSTDHPPMPEFFADAALYYRSCDADHLAERLNVAMSLPAALRQGLRERARARAAAFTWEATARSTVFELQQAIERCPSVT